MTREEQLFTRRYVFGGVFVTANTLQTVMDRILTQVGLTSKQWLLLAVLEEFCKDEPPTLKEAAVLMGSTHQNVKQIALKLQEKGFVSLEKDEKDKRIVRIRRIGVSEDLGEAYEEGAVQFIDTLFEGFTEEELGTTMKVLFEMNERLKILGEEVE
ncbi:MAG: MarR family winged helix-turn-helix transcriptional regulator [Cellulosilyticaceae bacterium]